MPKQTKPKKAGAKSKPKDVPFYNGVKVLNVVEGGKSNEIDVECRLANGTTTMVPRKLVEPAE